MFFTSDDQTYFLVINHYCKYGKAFAETGLDRADYETTVADLMTGQHSRPAARGDVQHRQEILRRLDLEGRNVLSDLEDFIDRHVGRGRQLTLRLALT